jgi:hypothetical protein
MGYVNYYKMTNFSNRVTLPCGAVAQFDEDSGIAFRCETCEKIWESSSNQCYSKYKLAETLKDKS